MEQVLIRLQTIINRCVKVKEGRSTAGNGGAFFITWGGVEIAHKNVLTFLRGPNKHRDDKGFYVFEGSQTWVPRSSRGMTKGGEIIEI